MSDKYVVGIDPGVGSIGMFRRDIEQSNLDEQLLNGVVQIFSSGVTDKENTKSLATERGEKRRSRKHYYSRKQCKWATLELLIKHGMCPLSIEDLNLWRKYDKNAEVKHPYPTHAKDYISWLRCDFNNDGKVDSGIFELRNFLATDNSIDLSSQEGKYKLGRVVYHMALHRGFRSSKGEKATDSPNKENEQEEYKGSEEEKAFLINKVMEENNLPTVGCALYYLNSVKKERIRMSNYTIIAKQNKKELEYIFEIHTELGDDRVNLCRKIIKTVFKVKPIKFQKGSVGHCIFEKGKKRSIKAHPDFEIYRAWSFINNIRIEDEGLNNELPLEVKQKIFEQKFWKHETFSFKSISGFVKKTMLNQQLKFNYDDDLIIEGCPILNTLKDNDFLGDEWRNKKIEINETRVSRKGKVKHKVIHSWETIWNKCYTGDKEDVVDFCYNKLKRFEWEKSLLRLMNLIQKNNDYTHMSTHAIRKINIFLQEGYSLDKSVLLAKIPDILGLECWEKNKGQLIDEINGLQVQNKIEKMVCNITNNLISSYKKMCLIESEAFAIKDYKYELKSSDIADVESAVRERLDEKDKNYKDIFELVKEKYQAFFADRKRAFVKVDSLRDMLLTFLADNFDCDATMLYNHSIIDKYTYIPEIKENKHGIKVALLGKPNLHNLKNPVVLRTMYKMRNLLNYMLLEGEITNDTRLVIETANEFNDANMRKAIELYQNIRKKENEYYRDIVNNILNNYNINSTELDVNIARWAYEQNMLLTKNYEEDLIGQTKVGLNNTIKDRYKLWKEQNFICIYTGRVIKLSEVLNGDSIDIEHTLPLSRSLDDSQENKTLCDSNFNRRIKQNKIPAELEKEKYDTIINNIKPWIDRVEFLKNKVNYWKGRVKKATTKEDKDIALQRLYMYRMDYDYWNGKVSRFMMKTIDTNFVHRQLSDTRTITRFLVDYLRVVFPNVSVQNSNVTAAFRKILGILPKDRNTNLHHAEDAAILSLIPPAYIRDRMMQLFYEIEDMKKYQLGDNPNQKIEDLQKRLSMIKKQVGLDSNVNEIISQKVDKILVNNIATQRTLNITRRKYRVRGRVVPLRDNDGNVVRDKDGNVVPSRWHQGDCVRGILNKDTMYGSIRIPQRNKDGSVMKDKNGFIIYEQKYVVRKSIVDIKKIIDSVVDENLKNHIKGQISNGIIYDKSGNVIRHVRCITSNGVISIKNYRDYSSKKEYKNSTYVENGSNAFYAIYEDENGKKKCMVYNLHKISQFRNVSSKDELFPLYLDTKNKFKRKYVLYPGIKVIFKVEKDDVISMLGNDEISNRLYIVNNFQSDNRVILKHHKEARKPEQKECKINFTIKEVHSFLRLSCANLTFWVEGYDFEMTLDGKIILKK